MPVDTTKAIKDIKPPIEVPWTLADFLPYIIGASVSYTHLTLPTSDLV